MIYSKAMDSGDVIPMVQAVPEPLSDLPNVPLLIDFAKTDEDRQLVEVISHANRKFNRSFTLPPGTPKERVWSLRKAFQDTMKDKDFLAEMNKAKLGIDPVSGEELEKAVARIFEIDSALREKMDVILFK